MSAAECAANGATAGATAGASEVPPLGVLTCLWRRHELARFVCERVARVTAELSGEIDVVAVAVGSEGEVAREIAESCGWRYVEAPNQPLGRKWNTGMAAFADLGVRGVVIIGSDDLIDAELLRAWSAALADGATMCGLIDAYFVSVPHGRALHWRGYGSGRVGETVGAGRCLSSELLVALGWEPWPADWTCSLDRGMSERIQQLAPALRARAVAASMQELSTRLVDVKSDADVDIGGWGAFVIDHASELVPMDAALGSLDAAERAAVLDWIAGHAAQRIEWQDTSSSVALATSAALSAAPRVAPRVALSAALVVRVQSERDLARAEAAVLSVTRLAGECVVGLLEGSTDSADVRLRELGARTVRLHQGHDCATARRELIAEATARWVLVLEQGEVLTDAGDLAEVLVTAEADGFDGVLVRVSSVKVGGVSVDRLAARALRREVAVFSYEVSPEPTGLERVVTSSAVLLRAADEPGSAAAAAREARLRDWLGREPEHPHALFHMARCHLGAGRTPAAHAVTTRLIDVAGDDPRYAVAWVWLVESTLAQRGIEPAEEVLRAALARHAGLADLQHLRLSLATLRWVQALQHPGPYALSPQTTQGALAELPEAAALIGLPFRFGPAPAG